MTIKKLSPEQAAQLVKTAHIHVRIHWAAKYRFGQALWNILPDELASYFRSTEHDFFYLTNENKVLSVFLDNYVEQKEKTK